MSSSPIRIGTSPLTNNIYAGKVRKDGRTWCDGKTDVTHEALGAVAEHIERFGKPIVLTQGGKPVYEITVRRLTGEGSNE